MLCILVLCLCSTSYMPKGVRICPAPMIGVSLILLTKPPVERGCRLAAHLTVPNWLSPLTLCVSTFTSFCIGWMSSYKISIIHIINHQIMSSDAELEICSWFTPLLTQSCLIWAFKSQILSSRFRFSDSIAIRWSSAFLADSGVSFYNYSAIFRRKRSFPWKIHISHWHLFGF